VRSTHFSLNSANKHVFSIQLRPRLTSFELSWLAVCVPFSVNFEVRESYSCLTSLSRMGKSRLNSLEDTLGNTLPRRGDLFSTPAGDKDIESEVETKTSQPDSVLQVTDPNIVGWDGDDDPEKAVNWPSRKKWINITLLAILTLLTCVLLSY
jgi:hypothetical protein